MERFYIQTYGCQMNVADSQRMSTLLESAGFAPASGPEEASVILLNTCSVRERPELKVYSKLGELRRFKKRRPELVLGVCGCQAQREGESLLRNIPHLDLVVGTAQVERIADLVQEVRESGRRLVALDMPERGSPSWMSPEPHMTRDLVDLLPQQSVPARPRLKAFVPVILGCDFRCTFCIVPSTRGPERSRPVAQVLGEIRALAQTGTREVMLLGQTVDAYRAHYQPDDEPGSRVYGLADLIWLVAEIDGIDRIRFTSPHPMLMHDELIDAVARCPKACEWIHLPVQSGSDAVLKRMARRYTRARYLERVAAIRRAMPDCAITTDIIVGFPGETAEQFEETMTLVEEVRFDGAYTFAYSPRPGTPAHGWSEEASHGEKIERLNRLIALQNSVSSELNKGRVGEEFEVLVESPSPEGEGLYTGHTRGNKTCHFPGHAGLIGRTVRVRATRGAQWGFIGEIVGPAPIEIPVLSNKEGRPETACC